MPPRPPSKTREKPLGNDSSAANPAYVTRSTSGNTSLRSENSTNGKSAILDRPEVMIALMGATGSGKSSFINLVSGSDLCVGNSLRSCTSTVQPAPAFDLDGRRVVLVDMPGFDDTTRSDTEILEVIADFLATSYKEGRLLTGVLYFHRISDVRMGGVATKNFKMFQRLCAGLAFPNVVIVTNMWEQVDPEVGHAREAELMNDDLFYKIILDKGAHMARHMNTASSARSIIRLILNEEPRPLHIQKELVELRRGISQTSAGEELNKELNAQIEKHEKEMRALNEEMAQAIKENDEEARREIEVETKKMEMAIAKFKDDARRLGSSHGGKKFRSKLSRRPTRVDKQDKQDKQEVDRKADRYQGDMDERRKRDDSESVTSSSGFPKVTAKAVKKAMGHIIGGKNPPSNR